MSTATDWEGLLNGGIAAYKQGEYEQAIALLKKLSKCPSSTVRTKAGMGLARAYMAQQDWARAESLCSVIGKSSKPSVQKWASDTLSKIEARRQQSSPNDASGFTPLEPSGQPKTNRMVVEPLSDSISAPTGLSKRVSPKSVPKTGAMYSAAEQGISTPSIGKAEPESVISMFHYAYLNGEIDRAGRPIAIAESRSASATATVQPEPSASNYEWRNAGRLRVGRSLGKLKRQQIWFAQTLGAIALYSCILALSYYALLLYNQTLSLVDDLIPSTAMQRLPFEYLPQTMAYLAWKVLIAMSVVAIASPWLWDLCLRFTSDRQPFSNQKLRQHSSEAASLVTKRCQKRKWPMPKIWKMSTDVPLIFSYGWLPRTARLVISDGLLSELSEEELAAVVGYELSHWKTIYWPLLSLQGLLLLVFHQMYWAIALWGNRQSGPLRWGAGIASTISYCLFWGFRLPLMWINRVRTYYGDRFAAQLTGNPNALARALTKLSFALARSTEQQGYTPPVVERFSLLLPVSMELTRAHLYGAVPLSDLFAWDSQHPLRGWMSVSDPHPPLGDRLRLLMAYAQHWKLDLEIPFAINTSRRKKGLSRQSWATLIRQGTPFFGLLFGSMIGLTCLLIGAIGRWLEWPVIDWMHEDPGIFWFCPLMGLGLGTFLRLNAFFPDLSFQQPLSQDLSERLCDKTLLPVDSPPTKLSGTLIGRPGLANWLGQDVILKTADGLMRLHIFSTLDTQIGPLSTTFLLAFGPFGNTIRKQHRLADLRGKSVQILGWFRRGNHIWLDVDKVRLSSGRLIEGTHPTTSLIVAIASSGLALWLLGFAQIAQMIVDKVFG